MAHHNALPAPAALGALALLLSGGGAMAQSMSTNSAEFNGGWGRANGQENHASALSMVARDPNGNREVINGVMQTGAQTVQARAAAAAGAGYSGGVGGGSALAVGNSLTVVTQGDYNTVIVNSTQINDGDISAYANVSGGVGE